MLRFDHIVVSAVDLKDGITYVEDVLGVKMAGGGKHPAMSTHNALMGLGDVYLEVIAADPDAPTPTHPRWFDLDNFTGAPRLTNWVCAVSDLHKGIAGSPDGVGAPMALSRGDLHWTIAVAQDGCLPFQGAFPGLIDWGDAAHPTTRLPSNGCQLQDWTINHPSPQDLNAAFDQAGGLPDRVHVARGSLDFKAEVQTPHGVRELT